MQLNKSYQIPSSDKDLNFFSKIFLFAAQVYTKHLDKWIQLHWKSNHAAKLHLQLVKECQLLTIL
jgi:hypothetical protein